MNHNWSRHIGVYGICIVQQELLVVTKNRGPYIHRFDLPGGKLEENETIPDALAREFQEETGYDIDIMHSLGLFDFIIEMPHDKLHHIAAFYNVRIAGGQRITTGDGEDSSGAVWVNIDKFHPGNASPLVMKAVQFIKTNERSHQTVYYNNWITLDNPPAIF